MKEVPQTDQSGIQVEAVLRKRNQLTLPSEAVDVLGLREGDVVIIEVKHHAATLRPVRRSYAGALTGVYGDANEYVERERASWE
jgi:bifunctional DNA-binding transcriptional regulator/antitoxin component of YhaV-PrlF toxin-antitoxin module